MKSSTNNRLFLVDGSSVAFRSFFALINTDMRNSTGMPTWAIYGFFNTLFDLIEKQAPHSLAICFDTAEPTFRHEEFEDYKANRAEMPDDLSVQWPLIKELVLACSIPLYELPGYEADDVIGTVAKKAEARNLSVVILTGDQDAFQLLDDNIEVLMPTKEGLKTFGRQEVFDKLAVWPEQIIDYKGLCGDSSDNIPGVRGIGPKTASQLLAQFGSMKNIYENLEQIKSASVKNKLTQGRDSAFASQDLATIRLDIPLEFDFDHCLLSLPNIENLACRLKELEFKALLKRLPKVLVYFNQGASVSIDPKMLEISPKSKNVGRTDAGNELLTQTQLNLLSDFSDSSSNATVALMDPPAHQTNPVTICTTEEQVKSLLKDLTQASGVVIHPKFSHLSSLNSELIGLTFAWSDAFSIDDDKLILSKAKSALLIKFAFVPCYCAGVGPISCQQVLEILRPFLEDTKISKMAFDCKSCLNLLSLYDIKLSGLAFDPMLASYIVNPDDNHKLAAQAQRILGRSLFELVPSGTGHNKILSLDTMPISEFAARTLQEATVVYQLCLHYISKFDHDQQELFSTIDLPVTTVLATMEQNGIMLDVSYFKQLETDLKAEITRLELEIHGLAGHEFNVNSPLQLQKVLFEELKLPAKVKTKTGYSTDAAVLESLAGEHEIVSKILEFRQVSKLNSTYAEALPKLISPRDGRLHGEFNQTVTTTGRLSSSNPNLQNIPIRTELGRRIRKGFIPQTPGDFLISADYSQIELRLLAHMSGDENLIEAFRQDKDIHALTAALIFDVPENKVTDELRRVGKTLNFALIYQQGAFSTGQSLGISTREAQTFIEKYFASFPKVRIFMNHVLKEARENGYVQTLWGRRRYFHHLNDSNDNIRKADERAAFNAPLQGGAADLIKLSMIKLHAQLQSRNLKSKLILQVHDELVLEVPAHELEETKQILLDTMTKGQPLAIPLKVDVGVAHNWMDCK